MRNSIKKTVLLGLVLFALTGCTTYLKDSDNKSVINPKTGQSLTENILCRPTDEETIKLYLENGVDLEKLPYCVCEEEYVTDDSKYKLPEKEEKVENTENTEEKVEETKVEEKKEDKKVEVVASDEDSPTSLRVCIKHSDTDDFTAADDTEYCGDYISGNLFVKEYLFKIDPTDPDKGKFFYITVTDEKMNSTSTKISKKLVMIEIWLVI